MKSAKHQREEIGHGLLEEKNKKRTVGKKSQNSPVHQRKKKSEQGDCNTDKSSKPGPFSRMIPDINHGDERMHNPSKIKMQLFPLDERIRLALEKDGRNPFLELTLSPRKNLSSVLSHLLNKWGSSSIAVGELMLFPFDAVMENLTRYKSWSSNDYGITTGDIHSAVGSPEIFRLRYGWISSHPNGSTSLVSSHSESLGNFTMETVSAAENQAETKSKELVPSTTNDCQNEPAELAESPKPFNLVVQTEQAGVTNEDFIMGQTDELENRSAAEKQSSPEPDTNEETLAGTESSQPSALCSLWSDLSNISFGAFLSEASQQGKFNTSDLISGSSRLAIPDSMDAFINQLNSSIPSTSVDTPGSFFDAENTCHSFGLSKPLAVKDFLSLGRGAFSGISSQDTASRPSRFSFSEANAQNDTNGCDANVQNNSNGRDAAEKPNAEALPCSAGVYNNENSLGLSSIRWNDSLGPFDLPLIPRQITKDDSISLGGFVR